MTEPPRDLPPPPLSPPLPPPDPERYAEKQTVGVSVLIPLKNPHALWAYYLGLFSLFPVLGIAMAVTAIVLARKALRKHRANPQIRGATHAWFGIVGAVFGLIVQGGLIALVVGMWPR